MEIVLVSRAKPREAADWKIAGVTDTPVKGADSPWPESDLILDEVNGLDEETFPGNKWGRDSFSDSIENKYYNLFVAVEKASGTLIVSGFSLLRVLDDAEIIRIAVRREYRGRGVARSLLKAMLKKAEELGAGSVFLEVRSQNEAALGLYRSEGFKQTGVRKGYYQSPADDAIMMRFIIC